MLPSIHPEGFNTMLCRQRERREKASWAWSANSHSCPGRMGSAKHLLKDFSLNETRLGLLRAFQKEVLFGTACIEIEVVLQYYKCDCVDFFLVSNLEVYFLINCSI